MSPAPHLEAATYVPARERTPFGQFQLHHTHLTTSIPGGTFAGAEDPLTPDVLREARVKVRQYVRRNRLGREVEADLLARLGLDDEQEVTAR